MAQQFYPQAYPPSQPQQFYQNQQVNGSRPDPARSGPSAGYVSPPPPQGAYVPNQPNSPLSNGSYQQQPVYENASLPQQFSKMSVQQGQNYQYQSGVQTGHIDQPISSAPNVYPTQQGYPQQPAYQQPFVDASAKPPHMRPPSDPTTHQVNSPIGLEQQLTPNVYQPPMSNRYPQQPPLQSLILNQPAQSPIVGQQQWSPQSQQPQQQQYYGQQPQQAQRLDPDAMPSVVQVVDDDKTKFNNSSNVLFQTTVPSTVPPLITSVGVGGTSVIDDGGTARPNHLRCSVYQVPTSEDILKTTGIPLSITVKPFDEEEIDGHINVPLSSSEIVRCNRCKAYMNPFMRFTDGGKRFQCALCKGITEAPETYFAHLDHTGKRLDRFERPELYLGSYEFSATSEYCRKSVLNCRRPHIVFAFELTTNSKPIIKQIAKELPGIIQNNLPTDLQHPGSYPPLVGFITYNSKIQMYDILNNGHAHVICDIAHPFPPITTFLVDPVQHAEEIENFLTTLPDLYAESELETETILGPVIEAALQTCQVDIGNWYDNQPDRNGQPQPASRDVDKSVAVGKVYIFHCTLPTYGQDGVTPGRLKPRWTTSPEEIRKLLGSDKEKLILAPESSKYYNTLADKCVSEYGSGVELFLFPPVNGSFLDVASLSELARLTGSGGVFKYYNETSGSFLSDLKYSLSATFGFDGVMRVRTSAGVRPCEYIGNYIARNTTDIELATINAGNTIAIEIKYDDKLPEDDYVVIQVALLFTAVSGERRVRVHNVALQVCPQVADVYRNSCCDTLMNYMLRQSVSRLRLGEKTVAQVKEAMITRSVTILAAYRKHCAQPGSPLGQLILPEALKLLPVYISGALKCDALDGGPEMLPDDKAYAQIRALSSSVRLSQVTLYPRLLCVEYEEDGESLRSVHVRCSAIRLGTPTGLCYILENGFYLFMYIPTTVQVEGHSNFLKNVFGVDSVQQIQPELGLPELLTQESQFLHGLLKTIYLERRRTLKVYVIRQGMDHFEPVFRSFLYEDKKTHVSVSGESQRNEAPSYVDLLCHLHKEIRAQLN